MKVSEIQSQLNIPVAAGKQGLEREVKAGYCGDLLSDVMANAAPGSIWLTVQGHQNVVAVAVLREMAAIILVNDRQPDQETKEKAEEEGVPILMSPLTAYEVGARLHDLGVGRESA